MTSHTPKGVPYVTGTDAVADYPVTSKELADLIDAAWRVVGAAGEPAFLNNWQAYNAPTYSIPRFRRDAGGIVRLSGLLAKSAGNWASNEAVFQLPAGYRPAGVCVFNLRCSSSGGENVGRLDVMTDGMLIIRIGGLQNPATAAGGSWANLETMHFPVA